MSTFAETVLQVVAYALIGASLAGWIAFRARYQPLWPKGHSPVGRHLIRTADSMIALLILSLVQGIVAMPTWAHLALTVVVAGGLCFVAWERYLILRREQQIRDELRRDQFRH